MHPELIQLEKSFNPSILTKVDDPWLERYRIELWLKRDDLLHPVVSGNKWRKLKYILDHALCMGSDTLISMGGAYSNHLHALAFAGRALGMKTVGLIRGECPERLTPTLTDMQDWGMELRFVSRTEYRRLREYKVWNELPGLKPGQYWITEGGAQMLAMKGLAELSAELPENFDLICAPCGTGTTLAGIVAGVQETTSILGFPVFKNARFLSGEIEALLSQTRHNWRLNFDYHFGGFAEINAELSAFLRDFESKTKIPLEPVYTGKMIYAIYDLIEKGRMSQDLRILAIHTGGLQGNRGFARG